MLGLFVLFFIGKYFYKLAEEHNEKKWLFTILGVVMYYVGTMVGGLILGVSIVLFDFNIDLENDLLMSVLALPFGLSACYLFYFLLEKSWIKKSEKEILSIDSIGKPEEENE